MLLCILYDVIIGSSDRRLQGGNSGRRTYIMCTFTPLTLNYDDGE
jgi:hypothetical protein